MNKKFIFNLILQLFFSTFALANSAEPPKFPHPFYVGITGGYGSTTWEGLVPLQKNQNSALLLSTPIEVSEGGNTWGLFAGYELNQYFALETAYMQYADALVSFDSMSLFSFEHNSVSTFRTHTETIQLMGKIMLTIPNTSFRAFSSFGAAALHRRDVLYDNWHASPSFSVGLNHMLTPHVMGEFIVNYTAGYGEAQLNPSDVYFPFLYSAALRLAYRF